MTDPSQTPENPPATSPNAPSAVPPQAVSQPLPAAPGAPSTPQTLPANQQPSQSVQPQTTPVDTGDMVANQPAQSIPLSSHPSVQKAGVIRAIAQTLAGGPRYQLTPNSDGTVTRTPVPLSKSDILGALALEAISGSLAGLAQRGPGAVGRAGEAGFQQVSQQTQQAQQQSEAQAQADARAKASSLAQQASIHETNSRTTLNTQNAERLGIENLKDAVSENSVLLQGYKDSGAVSDENVTQDALMDGMKSGRYNSTKQVAIPDGWTNVNGKWEQTFSIVENPAAKVTLTQDDVDKFSAAHVRGFPPSLKVGANGYPIFGYMIASANQQLLANKFMLQEAGDVTSTLAKSDDPTVKKLAGNIPDFGKLMDDPKNGLAFQNALPKLQKYMHHDGSGDDFYQALVAMSQPTRLNPANPKQTISNTGDANAAQVIAGAFGNGDPAQGWKVLRAYHDQITPAPIKSETDAEGILTDPASTPREVAQAKRFLALATQQKAADAKADAIAKKAVSADASGVSDPSLSKFISTANVGADGVNHAFLSAMQQRNPGRASLIEAIGQGRDLTSKYGLNRKDGQALMADVNAAYPDFDQNKVEQYESALKDFGPGGKPGRNLISMNTALTHLQRSYDNVGLLTSTPGLSAVGSWLGVKGAGAYKADVNALASEIATAYKGGVPDKQEVERWYNAFTAVNPNTVRNAYSEAATLLLNRVSEMHDRWDDSVPSNFVAPTQFITDSAAQSFKHVTGNDVPSELRQRGSANPSTQHVVPAGATPGRDAQGNIIGYRTASGQVVRFQ